MAETDKYYMVLYDTTLYFFIGSYQTHKIYASNGIFLNSSNNSHQHYCEDGYDLIITKESFDKNGILLRTRERQLCYNKPIEITKEQFNMFKEEILKIQKLKDMFNTTATALYKSKLNASNKESHTTL